MRGLLPHPPTQATCGGRGTGGRVLGGQCPSDAHSRSQPLAADATALGAGSLELSSLSSGGPCPAWRPYQRRDFGDARSRRAASWHLDFGLPASMAGRMNVCCSKPPRWRRGHGGPGCELPPVIHRLCCRIILTLFFLSWQGWNEHGPCCSTQRPPLLIRRAPGVSLLGSPARSQCCTRPAPQVWPCLGLAGCY